MFSRPQSHSLIVIVIHNDSSGKCESEKISGCSIGIFLAILFYSLCLSLCWKKYLYFARNNKTSFHNIICRENKKLLFFSFVEGIFNIVLLSIILTCKPTFNINDIIHVMCLTSTLNTEETLSQQGEPSSAGRDYTVNPTQPSRNIVRR